MLVTGGAGYVGSVLVPEAAGRGARGPRARYLLVRHARARSGQAAPEAHARFAATSATARCCEKALPGCTAVIHLACISNDPSFELDPALGKSINYDAFLPLVQLAKEHGVRRFIYASSSSVYGIKEEENVTEDLPLEPLTDYSKYKAMCEEVLQCEARAGVHDAHAPPGHGVRLLAAAAARSVGQHPHQPRVSHAARSPSSAASSSGRTSTSRT